MRRWQSSLVSLSFLVGLSGCADDSTPKSDAEAQMADTQSESSDAAPAGDAASSTTNDAGSTTTKDAGSASADASRDGSSQSGQDAGASGSADSGSASSDASAGLISCDHRKVLCRIAEPNCPANQVASVESGCFGPCVVIDQCSCAEPAECPHEEMYVCHRSAKHCGPYVN